MTEKKKDVALAVGTPEYTLTGSLRIITICTADLESVRKVFVEALNMSISGSLDLEPGEHLRQNSLWGIPEDLVCQIYLIYSESDPEGVKIRVLVLDEETERIHETYDSKALGPLSIGFYNRDQRDFDNHLKTHGIGVKSSIKKGEIEWGQGMSQQFWKSVYKGPEFIQISAIEEKMSTGSKIAQTEVSEFSSPAYTSFVTDVIDEEILFHTKVLGMSVEVDLHINPANTSALNLSEGKSYRISKIRSKDNQKNYVIFIQFDDKESQDREVPPRLPNRGLVMWSFQTVDLGEVLSRAHAQEIKVYRTPRKVHDAIYGEAIAMTLLSPSGFIVEVYTTG